MKINLNETFNAFSKEQSFKLIDKSKKESKDFIFRNQYQKKTSQSNDMKNVKMTNVKFRRIATFTTQHSSSKKTNNVRFYFFKSSSQTIQNLFDQLLKQQISVDLRDILKFNSHFLRMLFQRFKNNKNVMRQIDEMQVEFIIISNSTTKNYYIAFTSKMSIKMKNEIRYIVLIDIDVEINVMTKNMIFKKELIMRS